MNTAHRVTQPDAIGVTLATIGAALMGVGAVQTAGLHQNVWSNPWFDGGCAVVAPGALLAISVIVSWWRTWQRRPVPVPMIMTQASDPEPSDASPLLLRAGKGDWRLFGDTVWVFGIPVRVTNVTDEPITLVRYHLLSGWDATQRPMLARKVQEAVRNCLAELSSAHDSELFVGEIIAPPDRSITRWFVNSAYAPQPIGGRPALTLQIKDSLDNTYDLHIPAHPPSRFQF